MYSQKPQAQRLPDVNHIYIGTDIWHICKIRSRVSSVKMGKILCTSCENSGSSRAESARGCGNSVWALVTKQSNHFVCQIKG